MAPPPLYDHAPFRGPYKRQRRDNRQPEERLISVPTRCPSNPRVELGEVVNRQRLLDVRHPVHHLLETVLAEQLVLLLLELFAEGVVLVPADDPADRRSEERRVGKEGKCGAW